VTLDSGVAWTLVGPRLRVVAANRRPRITDPLIVLLAIY
jgi:hypothetical protein